MIIMTSNEEIAKDGWGKIRVCDFGYSIGYNGNGRRINLSCRDGITRLYKVTEFDRMSDPRDQWFATLVEVKPRKDYCITIGNLMIHNKEQWDKKDYKPLLCVHWKTKDRSKRIFCI